MSKVSDAVRAMVLDALKNRNEAASMLADLFSEGEQELRDLQEAHDRAVAEVKARIAARDTEIRAPFIDAASAMIEATGPGEYRNPLREGETFKIRRFQARTGRKGGYFVDLLPKMPTSFKSGNGADEESSGNGPRDF